MMTSLIAGAAGFIGSHLESMRRCGVKRLFFASSSAIYGEKTDVILTEETGPLMLVSYYGASKLASEALISAYSHHAARLSCAFTLLSPPHLCYNGIKVGGGDEDERQKRGA